MNEQTDMINPSGELAWIDQLIRSSRSEDQANGIISRYLRGKGYSATIVVAGWDSDSGRYIACLS